MTKLRQFSKGQKLFIFMMIFVSGLLFYANGIAFNLFSAPMFANDIVAFVALAVAITFAMMTLTFIFRDMWRNGVTLRTKKQQVISAVKESEEANSTVPLPVSPPDNVNRIDCNRQVVQAITQKGEEKIKIELSEQDNKSIKQLETEHTKLICPACRKEFEMPIYLGELMVDFGPRKPSNLIRQCRHCGAIMALKQKSAAEEDVWKE